VPVVTAFGAGGLGALGVNGGLGVAAPEEEVAGQAQRGEQGQASGAEDELLLPAAAAAGGEAEGLARGEELHLHVAQLDGVAGAEGDLGVALAVDGDAVGGLHVQDAPLAGLLADDLGVEPGEGAVVHRHVVVLGAADPDLGADEGELATGQLGVEDAQARRLGGVDGHHLAAGRALHLVDPDDGGGLGAAGAVDLLAVGRRLELGLHHRGGGLGGEVLRVHLRVRLRVRRRRMGRNARAGDVAGGGAVAQGGRWRPG
jgi:hypothetical protein